MDVVRTATRSVRLRFPELDNNVAERSMRPIALARRHYLFKGLDGGGKAMAITYALVESGKLNSVGPRAWLNDVLGCIADHRITRLDELVPWRCLGLERNQAKGSSRE